MAAVAGAFRKRRACLRLCERGARLRAAGGHAGAARREPDGDQGAGGGRGGGAVAAGSTGKAGGQRRQQRSEGIETMILLSDLGQAFGNLRAQKTRTLLTALGIVF